MKQLGKLGFVLLVASLAACSRAQTSVVNDAKYAICDDHVVIAETARTLEREHPRERFEILSQTSSSPGWTAIRLTRLIDPSVYAIDDEVRETLLVSFSGVLQPTSDALNNDSLCTVLVRGSAFGPGHVTALRPTAGVVQIEGSRLTIDIEAGTPEVLYGRSGYQIERTRFRVNL